jgi:hypothetical protein
VIALVRTSQLRAELERCLPERPFEVEFWGGSRLPSTTGNGVPNFRVRSRQGGGTRPARSRSARHWPRNVFGELVVDDIDATIGLLDTWQPPPVPLADRVRLRRRDSGRLRDSGKRRGRTRTRPQQREIPQGSRQVATVLVSQPSHHRLLPRLASERRSGRSRRRFLLLRWSVFIDSYYQPYARFGNRVRGVLTHACCPCTAARSSERTYGATRAPGGTADDRFRRAVPSVPALASSPYVSSVSSRSVVVGV